MPHEDQQSLGFLISTCLSHSDVAVGRRGQKILGGEKGNEGGG